MTPETRQRLERIFSDMADTPDPVRSDANNIVLVYDTTDGETRTFAMTTNGQVYVTEIIIRDGAAVGRTECLSMPIEDGMTAEQYADKVMRDFPAMPPRPLLLTRRRNA